MPRLAAEGLLCIPYPQNSNARCFHPFPEQKAGGSVFQESSDLLAWKVQRGKPSGVIEFMKGSTDVMYPIGAKLNFLLSSLVYHALKVHNSH